MSRALRWLLLLLVVFAAPSAAAHPLLEDALSVTVGAESVQIDVRSTLRPVVVAVGATPAHGSYFTLEEMNALVRAHAAYLAQHVTVRGNDQRLLAGEKLGELVETNAGPVQEHVDLERLHAHFRLIYPARAALTRLSLEQDMLSDAPSDRTWRVTYVVSVRRAGDASVIATGLLTRERGFDVQLTAASDGGTNGQSAPKNFWGYFWAGIRHIVGGWDHLLFVSALVLATRRLAELVKVVLAFTVAHSLTLTLAVLHVLRLPSAVVEPLIALSIVVVSLQNLLRPASNGAGAARLVVAFGFGLVHGLGFAGPLVEALQGAPRAAIAVGVIGFSLGVELGHQLVVLPLFGITRALAHATHDRADGIVLSAGSVLTACGGVFFLVRALQTFVLA